MDDLNLIKNNSNIDNSLGLALAYKLKEKMDIRFTKETVNLKHKKFSFDLIGNSESEIIDIVENIDRIIDTVSTFFGPNIDNIKFSNIVVKYNKAFKVYIDYIDETKPENDIEKWRKIVDNIDSDIIMLLSNRFIQAQQLAYMKKEAGLPVEDLERENEILKNIENCGLSHANAIKEVYKTIFKEMKGIEAHENNRHIR